MSESDGNFNDAELQDIMNEIESLEKEFQEEGAPEAQAADTTQEETHVEEPVAEETQEEVVAEASESDEDESVDEDFVNEAEEYEEIESNVVAMPKRAAPTGSEGYMEFSGQGNMDLSLSLPVGSETATVQVTSEGLKVTMAGVELHLSETGCEVEMHGGVKFSVPLTGEVQKGKKAA